MKLKDLLPIAPAFAAPLALTPAVRALARRVGMVARPEADRWHTRPTAWASAGRCSSASSWPARP